MPIVFPHELFKFGSGIKHRNLNQSKSPYHYSSSQIETKPTRLIDALNMSNQFKQKSSIGKGFKIF